VTLVEVLVVIGIIGLLVGLTLPAVQRVRGSAARAGCQNNLKQLGLACQNYHAAAGALPPGGVDRPNNSHPQMRSTSWFVRLTPYLEQQAVWDRAVADFANPAVAAFEQHAGPHTLLRVLQCPADGRLAALQSGRYYSTFSGAAFTGYVGAAGTNQLLYDGVLYTDSAVRLEQVTDGTSNTLLCGERTPNLIADRGVWYMSSGLEPETFLGTREVVLYQYFTACVFGPYRYGPGSLANPCDDYHYWSLHPGGANFALCDGSVRFLPYAARDLMPALGTRAGGEVATVPD
jgi:prepilin-type processing-associated H-X9-DG protein